jgi:effector-binding domain-containing protein
VDIEIQNTIDTLYPNTSVLSFYEVPPISLVSVTFHGSFEQMPRVTSAIARYMEVNNYVMDGPTLIISHISSAISSNPNDWISEVCYQIKGESLYGKTKK